MSQMSKTLNVDIDDNFSVYALVERVMQDNITLESRRAMSAISHEIEDSSIIDGANNRIFSSFQRMSKFLPQVGRYEKLAQNAEEIYVFGVMDISDLPNIPRVQYVPLKPHQQLAKEWFLVSYGTDFYSALVTEELTHIDDPDDQREFQGLWTFDLNMVSTLHEWLAGVVGISPNISQMRDEEHDYENQVRLMGRTIQRLMHRNMVLSDQNPQDRKDASVSV
jgi:DICT domain-containing protein